MTEEKDISTEENTQKGRFMVFQVGKEYFGISIRYVNEIVVMQPITAIPESRDYVKGMINLRGKVIPAIDMRTRFKMEPVEYTDRTCIIVLDVKSVSVGLIVERIAEVNNISDEDIVPAPSFGGKEKEKNEYVYGLAKTGDTVKLLLDPEKLIDLEEMQALEQSQGDAE